MKELNKTISSYNYFCDELAGLFVKQYFTDKENKLSDVEFWWVAGRTGTVLSVNDYFFDMEDMALALEWRVKPKVLFAYADGMAIGKDHGSLYAYVHALSRERKAEKIRNKPHICCPHCSCHN